MARNSSSATRRDNLGQDVQIDKTMEELSIEPLSISEGPRALARKRSRKRSKSVIKESPDINKPPTTPLDVFVFGSGEGGELGLGVRIVNKKSPDQATRPRLNPFLNPPTNSVVQISVGGMHCAALMGNGKVYTWGVNDSKALGRDTEWSEPARTEDDEDDDLVELNPLESTPMPVEDLDIDGTVVQVAATDNATFVLTSTGYVHGWGSFFGDNGAFGFVGSPAQGRVRPANAEKFSSVPIRIPGLSNIKELATGVNHLLALSHEGAVYSCGSGHQAELGRRILPRRPYAALEPRIILASKHHVKRIFAGFNHSFALDGKGRVYSWGLNNFGQTGHGISEGSPHMLSPAVVKSLEGLRIRQIAAGFHHTLACTVDGTLLAWGRCDDGQLGVPLDKVSREHTIFDNKHRPRAVSLPQAIPGIDAVSVAAGIDNCLAVTGDGEVYSWGFSANYRTGLGTEDTVLEPTKLRVKDLAGCKIDFAGCGGQFSIVAGPAETV